MFENFQTGLSLFKTLTIKTLIMSLTSLMYKALYWYINTIDKKKEVLFMNYGYHDSSEKIKLQDTDEINRYSIQLYHRLAKMVDLKNKDIVEIGSGRGGGLAYITKTFIPANALGIDLDMKATKFGNKQYKLNGLSFKQGNAQELPLADESVDIVLNVESSHRYPNMEKFLSEVYRTLKPGGHFLFTDFRFEVKMKGLTHLLAKYDFVKFNEQIINKEVIKALELDTARREELVNRYAPPFLRKSFHDFAGNYGSPTFNHIKSGEIVYFVLCFQKPIRVTISVWLSIFFSMFENVI
jgi:ubiquinone/menaquinone biosynthesis C-methylase UbiE